MRQALLTCDRCGIEERIDANSAAQGWRMVMSEVGTIAADLCPDCNAKLVGFMAEPAGDTIPLFAPVE